jgi:hypothetical protein
LVRLYHGSGDQGVELLSGEMPAGDWARHRALATNLLKMRGRLAAADLLERLPFTLREATNHWQDEFSVLSWSAALAQYEESAKWAADKTHEQDFAAIASVVQEVTKSYIRFIVVDLDTSVNPSAVQTPTLQTKSDFVERALQDAESLIATSGATSGVDRVHTALHAYLKMLCDNAGIAYHDKPNISVFYKALKAQHPKLVQQAAQDARAAAVLKSFSAMIDALNTVRNNNSMAHPSSALLAEPEAMAFINGVRTVLHYLNAKMT